MVSDCPDEGAWTLVKKRKADRPSSGSHKKPALGTASSPLGRRKGDAVGRGTGRQRSHSSVADVPETTEQLVTRLVTLIRGFRQEVKTSKFYKRLRWVLKQTGSNNRPALACSEMVIYGLGSLVDSYTSCYQLALALLLMKRHLPMLAAGQHRPQAYDPAFTDIDRHVLHHLGIDVITHNEGGARRAGDGGTLFYMPHCEGALCDRLLGANWGPDLLPRVSILGNSFDTYNTRWSARGTGTSGTATKPVRLLQLVSAGVVSELPTHDLGFPSPSAFNDMSLHMFSAAHCHQFFSGL